MESTLKKSDSSHYFGVDSTILRVDFHSKRSDPNMTPKRVGFHSTALRECVMLTGGLQYALGNSLHVHVRGP